MKELGLDREKNRIIRKGNNDFMPGRTRFCISITQEPGANRE